MARQALGDGRWFDIDKASKWDESTRWDGHNHISRATGSQWEHQVLYRTASGHWIVNHASGFQDTWDEVSNDDAARWLVQNEHGEHVACADEYRALEL